jgi:predicted anti-sigma-YlaC factor YlaD
MRCDRSRELISGALDGEGAGRPDELGRHLEGCAACRAWQAQARSLHRSLRLQTAPDVPDLTAAILRRSRAERPVRPRRRLTMPALRGALTAIAATQVVLALPGLFSRAAPHDHGARHLGGWDLAFAVGLLVVAAQPWRARGLLPMAAAVAGVMVATVLGDTMSGSAPAMAEGPHVLEVCGLALLWAIARAEAAGGRGGDGLRLDRRARLAPASRLRRRGTGWARAVLAVSVRTAQPSAVPSCTAASPAANSRITVSRARATRERTVPTGQSHTDAVSA